MGPRVLALWLFAGCQTAFGIHHVGVAGDAGGSAADASTDSAPAVPIGVVQYNAGPLPASASTVDIVLPMDQHAGDLNVVFVGYGHTFSGVASVTDTNNNSYTAPVKGSFEWVYYAQNIKAGPNTVHVTFNSATSYPDVRVLEYEGIATANAIDGYAFTSGSGATMRSGAVTTMHAYDLLVAGNSVGGNTSQLTPTYTIRIETQPNGNIAEDKVVTATGTYDAIATQTVTNDGFWTMALLAFKGALDAPP